MILLDTSGLLGWLDASQRLHAEIASCMLDESPPFLLSPFVLAELDYLLATRVGSRAQQALLEEVERGALELAAFTRSEVGAALELIRRFEDLEIGLADASIVVLAERHSCARLLTLDERHFRLLPGPSGQPFTLVPADCR